MDLVSELRNGNDLNFSLFNNVAHAQGLILHVICTLCVSICVHKTYVGLSGSTDHVLLVGSI